MIPDSSLQFLSIILLQILYKKLFLFNLIVFG